MHEEPTKRTKPRVRDNSKQRNETLLHYEGNLPGNWMHLSEVLVGRKPSVIPDGLSPTLPPTQGRA
jgi:hypothetical protein